MEPCINTQTIKDIKKELWGNGRQGMVKDVENLKTNFDQMTKDVESLAVSYSALVKSQIEQDVTDRIKAETSKSRSGALKSVGIVFSIVFGIVGTLFVILNFIN